MQGDRGMISTEEWKLCAGLIEDKIKHPPIRHIEYSCPMCAMKMLQSIQFQKIELLTERIAFYKEKLASCNVIPREDGVPH